MHLASPTGSAQATVSSEIMKRVFQQPAKGVPLDDKPIQPGTG